LLPILSEAACAAYRDLGQVEVDRRTSRRHHGGGRPALATLTFAQLCALWRKSAAGLAAAATPRAELRVVEARARLLAELELREPVAMAAWIAAGALEPAGPPAYLLGTASMSSRDLIQ
jgi:hypothetical protein